MTPSTYFSLRANEPGSSTGFSGLGFGVRAVIFCSSMFGLLSEDTRSVRLAGMGSCYTSVTPPTIKTEERS